MLKLKKKLPPAPTLKVAGNVLVTLPYVKESPTYLEVKIAEKPSWLAKETLEQFVIRGAQVVVEMKRAQARRRGLV